ncbi:MAG: hypothetical protein R3F37_09105 [Candidatus Competibacteraceae bacterium]
MEARLEAREELKPVTAGAGTGIRNWSVDSEVEADLAASKRNWANPTSGVMRSPTNRNIVG